MMWKRPAVSRFVVGMGIVCVGRVLRRPRRFKPVARIG